MAPGWNNFVPYVKKSMYPEKRNARFRGDEQFCTLNGSFCHTTTGNCEQGELKIKDPEIYTGDWNTKFDEMTFNGFCDHKIKPAYGFNQLLKESHWHHENGG